MTPRPLIDDEKVAQLTRAGYSIAQIAQELNFSRRTVVRARNRAGVAGAAPHFFSAAELELAEQMISDGASIAETARTLNRGIRTLYRRFAGRGWTREQIAAYNASRFTRERVL